MAYIARVWQCVECKSAVGEYLDGSLEHIEVHKSTNQHLADTATILHKDHSPNIGVQLQTPLSWWTGASDKATERAKQHIIDTIIEWLND